MKPITEIYEGIAELLIRHGQPIGTHHETDVDDDGNASEYMTCKIKYDNAVWTLVYFDGELSCVRRTGVDAYAD